MWTLLCYWPQHVEALIHEELSPPSFAFKAVNCVDHLVELDIVTVRSTAL